MDLEKLKNVLRYHRAWLEGEPEGSRASLSGADLRGADLSGAGLRGADLSDADLRGASLSDADLRGASLSGADLSDASLSGASLSGASLSGASLRGVKDFPFVPVVPHIDAAILTVVEAGGTLDMGDWHKCETTHCRAGWAITLAGEAGLALERRLGPSSAGALIYAVSRDEPVPDFFASNEAAMEDLKRGAEKDPLPAKE